jgi:hypothetical protein
MSTSIDRYCIDHSSYKNTNIKYGTEDKENIDVQNTKLAQNTGKTNIKDIQEFQISSTIKKIFTDIDNLFQDGSIDILSHTEKNTDKKAEDATSNECTNEIDNFYKQSLAYRLSHPEEKIEEDSTDELDDEEIAEINRNLTSLGFGDVF